MDFTVGRTLEHTSRLGYEDAEVYVPFLKMARVQAVLVDLGHLPHGHVRPFRGEQGAEFSVFALVAYLPVLVVVGCVALDMFAQVELALLEGFEEILVDNDKFEHGGDVVAVSDKSDLI